MYRGFGFFPLQTLSRRDIDTRLETHQKKFARETVAKFEGSIPMDLRATEAEQHLHIQRDYIPNITPENNITTDDTRIKEYRDKTPVAVKMAIDEMLVISSAIVDDESHNLSLEFMKILKDAISHLSQHSDHFSKNSSQSS